MALFTMARNRAASISDCAATVRNLYNRENPPLRTEIRLTGFGRSRASSILENDVPFPLYSRRKHPATPRDSIAPPSPLQKPPRESLSRLRHTVEELSLRTPTSPFPTRGQQCLHGRNPSIRFTNLKAKRPECFPFLWTNWGGAGVRRGTTVLLEQRLHGVT